MADKVLTERQKLLLEVAHKVAEIDRLLDIRSQEIGALGGYTVEVKFYEHPEFFREIEDTSENVKVSNHESLYWKDIKVGKKGEITIFANSPQF